MSGTPRCLLVIRQHLPSLGGKYADIAQHILADPGRLMRSKGREIAEACGCDESLIIRFCQKLGFNGLSDLKASLAAEFMPVDTSPAALGAADGFDRLKAEFLAWNLKALQDTLALASEAGMAAAVDLLRAARRVLVHGLGASGIVAQDAQIKLLRLGFPALHLPDADMMRMVAGLAGPGDVLLAVSFSGETGGVCALAEHVRAAGGRVVAITNAPSSRLARAADALLTTASDEGAYRLAAMSSRLAQMVLLDLLVLSLAMRDLERSQDAILRSQQLLRDPRRS